MRQAEINGPNSPLDRLPRPVRTAPQAPTQETRSRARRLIDGEHSRGRLPDAAAESITELLTVGAPARDLDLAERWALAAGDERYRGAFAKLAMDPTARPHVVHDRRIRRLPCRRGDPDGNRAPCRRPPRAPELAT